MRSVGNNCCPRRETLHAKVDGAGIRRGRVASRDGSCFLPRPLAAKSIRSYQRFEVGQELTESCDPCILLIIGSANAVLPQELFQALPSRADEQRRILPDPGSGAGGGGSRP